MRSNVRCVHICTNRPIHKLEKRWDVTKIGQICVICVSYVYMYVTCEICNMDFMWFEQLMSNVRCAICMKCVICDLIDHLFIYVHFDQICDICLFMLHLLNWSYLKSRRPTIWPTWIIVRKCHFLLYVDRPTTWNLRTTNNEHGTQSWPNCTINLTHITTYRKCCTLLM